MKQPFYPVAKGSWAFIGYKGDGKVDWIQQQTRLAGQGPAKVSARVPQPGEEETKKNVVRRSEFENVIYLIRDHTMRCIKRK